MPRFYSPKVIFRSFASLLLPIPIVAISAAAHSDESPQTHCKLERVAELNMIANDMESPQIPVVLNGKPSALIIDTGAFWGILSRRSIGELKSQHSRYVQFRGFSGILDQYVKIPSLLIDQLDIKDMEFFVAPDAATNNLGIAGTLGANVLKKFDVEIDPGSKKINLFTQQHCPGQVVYWPQMDAVKIPFDHRDGWINIQVILDGKPMRAIIDTGTTDSILDLEVAKQIFQLSPETADLGAPGVALTADGLGAKFYEHQFKTLQIGDITFSNPQINLEADYGQVRKKKVIDEKYLALIIGMHQLSKLHLYIAYGEGVIYASTVRGDAIAAKKITPEVAAPNNLPSSFADGPDQKNQIIAETTAKEVIISILVRANGSIGDVKIMKSSGAAEIDDRIKNWYLNSIKLQPATQDGKPFDSRRTIKIMVDGRLKE